MASKRQLALAAIRAPKFGSAVKGCSEDAGSVCRKSGDRPPAKALKCHRALAGLHAEKKGGGAALPYSEDEGSVWGRGCCANHSSPFGVVLPFRKLQIHLALATLHAPNLMLPIQ